MRRRSLMGGSSRLPSEYQEVEYLLSHLTEKIDTLTKANNIDKWILDAQITQSISTTSFRGNGSYGYTNCRFDIGIDNKNHFWIAIGGINLSKNSDVERHTFILDRANAKASIDDYEMSFSPVTWNEQLKTITLFNRTYYGSSESFGIREKIYMSMFISGDTVIQHLVPCYRKSDNERGMYDIVTNSFFINQGTGTFEIGPNVN